MDEKTIVAAYEEAKKVFAEYGIDTEKAMEAADKIPVSMHCWQGDDVIGFDGTGSLDGGIQTTGNYPGRARSAEELRNDLDFVIKLIPGEKKLNLHANYAEKTDPSKDRDSYTIADYQNWVDWAKKNDMGLDFNPTYFSHPMMEGDKSLTARDETKRKFWIEHGKRCREIGYEFAKQLGKPCVINYWMPDGMKDTPVNTKYYRERMADALDQIMALDIDMKMAPCAIECKLFGIGAESFTVASHEFSYGYAIRHGMTYCLDAGHFHPTEVISDKISAVIQNVPSILLHLSRGVRWDSDHVTGYTDELQRIMDEIIWNGYQDKVYFGLDFFDASINRTACWVIGMRNARKAILASFLAPYKQLNDAEQAEDYTSRLALMEERRMLPVGAVFNYYCYKKGMPAGNDWLECVKKYEAEVLSKRS